MKFTKPNPFNGATFEKELIGKKIKISDFYDDGEGNIVVNADEKFYLAIQSTIENHDGSPIIPSVIEKLESAGVNLDELRVALGL